MHRSISQALKETTMVDLDLSDAASYPSSPAGECDLIMKGGISSGIVYPKAACTLAVTHRFRSVGGASAGAIAAAAAAAAEYGRSTGGFVRLAALPDELGTGLEGLFQPGRSTKRAFSILSAWLAVEQSWQHKLRVTLTSIASEAPGAFIAALSALLVLPFTLVILTSGAGGIRWLGWVIAALIWVPAATAMALIAATAIVAKRTLRGMSGNGYGLCNGHQHDPSVAALPLTDWMTQTFDSVAGLTGRGPLTFGDLWGTRAVALETAIDPAGAAVDVARRHADATAARQVDLVVMTTNLTFQRPYRFPFSGDGFYFCPSHLSEYFPDAVVDHMMATSSPTADLTDTAEDGRLFTIAMRCPDHDARVHNLPAAWDMPVVVAARISLSFPGLISAVPLFSVDWARAFGKRKLITVWFSDGGISSNFPMHFFDSAFPTRPTFGINLGAIDPDIGKSCWKPVDQGRSGDPVSVTINGMVSFGHSILTTMQNWVDNTQITMPGYRDRIATVGQGPGEGGMNLRMTPATISALADRGADAAHLFDSFDFDLHRWIRYRVAMGGTDDMLASLHAKYEHGFRDFIDTYGPTTSHFGLGTPEATAADATATAAFMALGQTWADAHHPASAGTTPAPKPDLRFVPRQ
jgi:predicted acylesterase/phospholipase RssA